MTDNGLEGSNFVAQTQITNVTNRCVLLEEIFGPVAVVMLLGQKRMLSVKNEYIVWAVLSGLRISIVLCAWLKLAQTGKFGVIPIMLFRQGRLWRNINNLRIWGETLKVMLDHYSQTNITD